MKKYYLLLILFLLPSLVHARFQNTSTPEVLVEGITIEPVMEIPSGAIRLSYNPADSILYYITQEGGIYEVDFERNRAFLRQYSVHHELADVQGFDIASDGRFFIVGNNRNAENATNVAVVKRGTRTESGWTWETVMQTAPYPLSNTAFDHIMNGIVVSPDGSKLYLNSGSRTDHGEVHDVDGLYPGLREAPLTAKILTVPSDTTDLLLENDIDFLKDNGFVYAEGTRNSFALAFDGDGNLFGTENAGDRDDPEELNWLREGHHYGFPWVIGGNNTPMQYEGYEPGNDAFVPSNSTAAGLGTFHDDPDYPARPDGVEFMPGVTNIGPDADTFRDSTDGQIKDASELGVTISTFSSHLSPLGLIFDNEENLGGEYTGDGFLLGFSGGTPGDAFLLTRMNYHGEDLIHLELTKNSTNFVVSATSLVKGFLNPIDAEIIGNKVYIIEHKNNSWLNVGSVTQLYAVTFPEATSIEEKEDLAHTFILDQNYPNPFNPTTVIRYQLPVSSTVELKVFNIAGREVASLVNGSQAAGEHSVTFDASGLSSDVYLYRLRAGNLSITRKMMLVK